MTRDELEESLQAANDCIVEILESYKEFCLHVTEHAGAPLLLLKMSKITIDRWAPILETAKKKQAEYQKIKQ